MKKIILSLFLISTTIFSQKKINNYKYIIVPEQFNFLKKTDQYQTSSLTKFLLKKKGFTVFLSNENLPTELMQNKCLALSANVLDESSMFSIKSKIQIKDCYGSVLYTSEIGKSKEKDYKRGYHEAIRSAFDSMTDLVYQFKEEAVNTDEVIVNQNISDDTVKSVMAPTKVIEKPLVKEEESKNNTEEVTTLYAQTIQNGFQLVNTKPEVVFQVLKTSVKDVFIINNKNGILYKNGTDWVAEYYKDDKIITENYQIKF